MTPDAASSRGFTLIEMVVSLAVAGILVGAMASAVALATRALPGGDGQAAAAVDAARVLRQLREELQAAVELPGRGEHSLVLTLPDRDGDGRPETIRYAWSGTVGDPLTRRLNAQPAAAVLQGVTGFDLRYHAKTVRRPFTGVRLEQPEVLLSASTSGLLTQQFTINGNNWLGFRVDPTLPGAAVDWRISRVHVQAKSDGSADGVTRYELTGWGSSQPAADVVDHADQLESSFGNGMGWRKVTFRRGGRFGAGQVAAVTLKRSAGSDNSAAVQFYQLGAANMYRSTNAGSSWTVYGSGRAVLHEAYGHYTTLGPPWSLAQPRVHRVDVSLSTAASAGESHRTSVLLPNAPDAMAALWDTDFRADPTALDLDGDGAADWASSPAFAVTRLGEGGWQIGGELALAPARFAFDLPTTIDLTLQDTTADGRAGGADLRVDRVGGQAGAVQVRVDLTSAGQRVSVTDPHAGADAIPWLEAVRPADAPVRLRLTLDPADDRIALTLDGQDRGTFRYATAADDAADSLAFVADGDNSGVRVRRVRVQVGGVVTTQVGGTSGAGSEAGDSGDDSPLINIDLLGIKIGLF